MREVQRVRAIERGRVREVQRERETNNAVQEIELRKYLLSKLKLKNQIKSNTIKLTITKVYTGYYGTESMWRLYTWR